MKTVSKQIPVPYRDMYGKNLEYWPQMYGRAPEDQRCITKEGHWDGRWFEFPVAYWYEKKVVVITPERKQEKRWQAMIKNIRAKYLIYHMPWVTYEESNFQPHENIYGVMTVHIGGLITGTITKADKIDKAFRAQLLILDLKEMRSWDD